MNWQDRIESNPEILAGKPAIKGTRLAVDFLLERLASGWTEKEILESYPRLTLEDLRAVFAYAAESVKDDIYLSRISLPR